MTSSSMAYRYDTDVRSNVLGVTDILQKPVNDMIALVENKETARNALHFFLVSHGILPKA